MKKLFLSFALMVAASAAFAVPNPKQIEQALEHGNCAAARNLVNEVLAARPDSARAHLLNSATIMCLERDPNMAQRELDAARELDRKGDVISSNLFAKMEGDISAAHARTVAPVVTYTAPVVAAAPVAQPAVVAKEEGSGFWGKFFVLILLAAGAGAIYALWRRSQSNASTTDYTPNPSPSPATSTASVSPATSTSSSAYNSRNYATPAPSYSRRDPVQIYPAPAPVIVSNGPSALETGIAVAGGVVVGNAISNALNKPAHDDSYARRRREEDSSTVYSSSTPSPAPYVASTPAPAPSVFSSSSDDGWGSGRSAPAPAPSNWSSSRDDDSRSSWSSSSSSDYSSSSSSDSSSSSSSDSGSSDW